MKARAESSIEGAWAPEGSNAPMFIISRNGDGFTVAFGEAATLSDIETTETTLKLVYQIMAPQAVDLRREASSVR